MATSDYLENALVNHVLRNTALTSPITVHLALFNANPTDANITANEVATASYARQTVTFTNPVDGATDNTAEIAFAQATESWGNVTHIGIYDASTLGNLLYHGALSVAKTVDTNDTFKISAGNLDITLS